MQHIPFIRTKYESKSPITRHRRHLLWGSLFVLALTFAANFLLRRLPGVVERVFVPLCKTTSGWVRILTNLLPFSLAELLLYMVVAGVLTLIIWVVWAAIHMDDNRFSSFAMKLCSYLAMAAALVYLGYNVLFGFAMSRPTLAENLALETRPTSPVELYNAATYLSQMAGSARRALGVDYNAATLQYDFGEIAKSVQEAFWLLGKEQPLFSCRIPRPKPVLASVGMSYTNIAGMYFPYTAETNINTDAPLFALPYTMAHEMGHAAMIGREDEANFVAFLATGESADPLVHYSCYVGALSYCMNALYRADTALYGQLLQEMEPLVLADLRAESRHYQKYQGAVANMSEAVNDFYIKASGQPEGVQSYGRVVDLLIAWYAAHQANGTLPR